MEKLNIICIDDQRDVLAAIQKDLIFFEPVADFTECESTTEAEEVLEDFVVHEKLIALIICDHIMPNETGIDFLVRLQHDDRFKNISTILLTGLATHQDTIEAINKAHISNYIEKPWQHDDLTTKVKQRITHFIMKNSMDYSEYYDYLDQETLLEELRDRG